MDLPTSNTPSPRSTSPAAAPSSQYPSLPSRPANPRSSTDPSPAAMLQGWLREKEKSDWARPISRHRNRSPYSRSHLRSRSSGSALLSAPLMARAYSLPNPYTLALTTTEQQQQSGSSSPGSLSPNMPHQRSPARPRSPAKCPDGAEMAYTGPPRSPGWFENPSSSSASMLGGANNAIPAIQEDRELELDLTPRPHTSYTSAPTTPSNTNSSPLPRPSTTPLASINLNSRRLSTSPGPTSHPASPQLQPQQQQRYNEAFPSPLVPPGLHHYASTSSFSSISIPSTPTSARSRSPSISSLDTIEDAPEAEEEESEAAVELERLERLRLGLGGEDSDGGRKGSLDGGRRGLGLGLGRDGGRKRWSVCGGERRGDLDLETIWED